MHFIFKYRSTFFVGIVFILQGIALHANKLDTVRVLSVQEHLKQSEKYIGSDLSLALRHAQLAKKLAILEDLHSEYEANMQLGRVCFTVGMFETAAEAWVRALECATSLVNGYLEAKTLFNLSALYIMLKDYEKAQFYHNRTKTFFYAEANSDYLSTEKQLMIINNEAVIASNLKNHEKANQLFQEGLGFAQENELNAGLRTIQNAYLSHLMNVEAYESAFELMEQSANLTNKYDSAYHLFKRAKIQMQLGATDDAFNDLRFGYSLARQSGNNTLILNYAEMLYLHEWEQGNAETALLFREVIDTIRAVEKAEEAKQFVLLQEVKDEYQKFHQETLAQRTTAEKIRFIVLFVFVLAVLGYLLYRQSKQSKISSNQLLELKQRLEEERLEIEQLNELKSIETKAAIEWMTKKNQVLSKTLSKAQVDKDAVQESRSNKFDKAHFISEFEMQLKLVEPEFYDKLYEKFPDITKNERRLCAFLRLGMSTKDIVSITGQSLRAVEMARIRLRKKLQLDTSENLHAFLRGL